MARSAGKTAAGGAKGRTSRLFVWIILGLLIIGLAGFGVDGFGGSVRGVAQVGDREITAQEYFRTLQRELRSVQEQTGQALPWSEAQAFGLDRAVLSRLVTTAALENEAMRLGISVSDETVRDELLGIASFRGIDGRFDREAYRFLLQQEGWSEREFEDRIRMELAREILQAGAVSAVPTPDIWTDTVFGWFAERRDFDVVTLDRGALETPIPAPTDAELAVFHADNPDLFTLPEGPRIAFAWITPNLLADRLEIPEEELRAAFEARAAEFVRPERRLVERLVFASDADAEAARARIDAGEADFADIVAERGMDLDDTDMGDVTEAELGAAGAEVFALDGPGLAGPLPSPFGPALFNVVAVLSAQETPFEDAAPQLRDEIALERARQVISDRFDDFEDILAGGATLEDLAEETELEFGTLVLRPDSRDGPAAYASFREAARAARSGGFPEMRPLEDGGVFALRHDGTEPARVQDLAEVEVRVIDAWDAAEASARVGARAEEVLAALAAGEEASALGLTSVSHGDVRRTDRLSGVPPQVVERAFALQPGDRAVVSEGTRAHVLTLRAIHAADGAVPDGDRAAIGAAVRESLAQDVFDAWARLLQTEAGIRVDQSAIDQVHSQFR
ncbi:MAG: SurA N-terminal domain-containing protein [Alkalilacustris sp.]